MCLISMKLYLSNISNKLTKTNVFINDVEWMNRFFGNISDTLKHFHAEPHNELVMLATFSIGNQEIMISDSFVSHEWNITLDFILQW